MFLLLSLYIASLGCAVAVPYFRYKYAPNRKDPVKFYKYPGGAQIHSYAKMMEIPNVFLFILLPILFFDEQFHITPHFSYATYALMMLLLWSFALNIGLNVYFTQQLKKQNNLKTTGKALWIDIGKDTFFFSRLYLAFAMLVIILFEMDLVVK